MLWDANYYENAEAFHTLGCSRIVPSNASPATGEGGGKAAMDATLEMYADTIQKADTLEELAEKLGIPSDNRFVRDRRSLQRTRRKGSRRGLR